MTSVESLMSCLGLSRDLATAVRPLFVVAVFDKGESVVCQGARWQHAVLVERGLLRMAFTDRDGREFNKNFHAEGAMIFPLTEAMWSQPSLFSVIAVERSLVWMAPIERLRERLLAEGQWDRLRVAALEGLISHKLQREHDLLMLDGRERYQRFLANEPHLSQRVPLVQLASYLGLTDVSLSRIRRSLRQEPKSG